MYIGHHFIIITLFSIVTHGRLWKIIFVVMNVHVLVFYIICSLTYCHIKIFARVKQKISYSHSSWTQTISAVKLIRWLYHWCNCKPFRSSKTEHPKGIFRQTSPMSKTELFLKITAKSHLNLFSQKAPS